MQSSRSLIAVCIAMLTLAILFIQFNVLNETSKRTWGQASILVAAMVAYMNKREIDDKITGVSDPEKLYANRLYLQYTTASLAIMILAVTMGIYGNTSAVIYVLSGALVIYGLGSNMLLDRCMAFQ